jgi:multidrug efflux pump
MLEKPHSFFVDRPVATSLLMLAIFLAGLLAYQLLPLSALPEVEYPTMELTTLYPGASPEVMATGVTAPLERQLGQIPGLSQMASSSSGGASVITLRFALGLPLDVAEQQVQAAMNAAANLLPADLPMPPIYRKVNPADAPILTLAVTSDSLPLRDLHEWLENQLAPKLSQVEGVGLVRLAGGRKPAVQIVAHAAQLAQLGLSLEDVRVAVTNANVNQAKGSVDGPQQALALAANDQLSSAQQYRDVVLAWRNGAPVRLRDVAQVQDGAENMRLAAWAAMESSPAQPGIVLNVQRQPGANVIQTVDRLQAVLVKLQASWPQAVKLSVVADRTTTIRASVRATQYELLLAVALVVAIIFVFLGSVRTTAIAAVAVPISLVGTLGVMYLAGFSINNLTLMALTVATGFVVDDAIVMIENMARLHEQGCSPMQAAIAGSKQMAFTVVALTVSLLAVLIPLLFMGDVVGRLFHEFAVTLAVAIVISAVVSLTLTPMMGARLLRMHGGRPSRFGHFFATVVTRRYGRALEWVLDRPRATMAVFATSVLATIVLYGVVPKGFFAEQDTGLVQVFVTADPSIAFEAMSHQQLALAEVLLQDPDVLGLVSFIGVDAGNSALNVGRMQLTLKPFHERRASAQQVMARLTLATQHLPGCHVAMQSVQDMALQERPAALPYQWRISSPSSSDLAVANSELLSRLKQLPQLAGVVSDLQNGALQADVQIDREAAGRLGVTVAGIDAALYNAFGQRLVSTVYTQSSAYRVVLSASVESGQGLGLLDSVYVPASQIGADGKSIKVQVPLSSVAKFTQRTAPLVISHVGQFPSATLSFKLADGVSLGTAVQAIEQVRATAQLPGSLETGFQGAAQAFQASLGHTLWLVLAALVTMYIVLGVLYESTVHPITILSTLPSAAVGALLALMWAGSDLGVVGVIGIVLLIGIVKKNAIMVIDFALQAQREQGLAPRQAVTQACMLRLRPIIMTTLAALLGAIPLMLSSGAGHELRQPLGLTLVGGLLLSQLLTLFTTPVIYLGLARWASK